MRHARTACYPAVVAINGLVAAVEMPEVAGQLFALLRRGLRQSSAAFERAYQPFEVFEPQPDRQRSIQMLHHQKYDANAGKIRLTCGT